MNLIIFDTPYTCHLQKGGGKMDKRRGKGRSEEERMGKHEREGVGSGFSSRCC